MNNINEWTQVYLNGVIPNGEGTNNLKEITLQLEKGNKSPAQIYSILRGMGVDDSTSKFAINTYLTTEKNKQVMEKNFNISDIEKAFENLKTSLLSLVKEEDSKFRYSAQKALNVTEVYLNRINDYKVKKEELKQVSEALTDLNSRNNKELYSNSIMEFSRKKGLLENLVVEKDFTEKYTLVKKAFADFDNSINWLNPITEMLNEFKIIINSNLFSFKLREAVENIKSSKHSSLYKSAISDIEGLCKLSESGIREEFTKVLEKHSWISEVDKVIKEFVKFNNLAASNGNGKISKVYSPVQINEDNSITVFLNGNFLVVENNKIRKAENVNEQFNPRLLNLLNAMKLFKITNESFQLFNGNKYLEIFTETGQIKVNDTVLEESSIENLRNYLLQSAFFRIDESYKIDQVAILIESLEDIKELDFIYSINSPIHEEVNVSVLNYKDSIYLNRVNNAMGINEFVKPVSATHAQALVNEYINYDISNMVYEHLENEIKALADLNNKKIAIKENIKFLESKLIEVKEAMKTIGAENTLEKAFQILNNELYLQEKSLQDVYISIGRMKNGNVSESDNLLDKGYVEAEVTKDTKDLKSGDVIFVLANDVTTSSDDDEITFLLNDKSKKDSIKKEFIKIK